MQRQLFVILIIALTAATRIGEVAAAVKCYACDSTTDPKCITSVTSVTTITDCAVDIASCYSSSDANGLVKRGCLTPDSTCTGDSCFSCTGDTCNTHPVCASCESKTDANCAQSEAKDTKYQKVCDLTAQCLKKVNTDMTVTRKCSTSVDDCGTDTTTCNRCNTAPLCNQGIFPENRRYCYQCSTCNEVTTDQNKICPLYDAKGECYTNGAGAATMKRGCANDIEDKEKAESVLCTSDGCNALKFERTVDSCIQCSGTSACVSAQDASKAEKCTDASYTQTLNGCYTHVKAGKAYRGCINQHDATALGDCTAANSCTTCSGDGCNILLADVTISCIRCRSDFDPKCRNDAASFAKKCDNQTILENPCFWGTWRGRTLRSCFADADHVLQYQCTNKIGDCQICASNDCNVKPIDSLATSLSALSISTALVFAAIVSQF